MSIRSLIMAVRDAQQITRTTPTMMTECIETTLKLDGKVFAAKNRDRAYKPELEVVHEVVNGTEIAYLRDVLTDWSEGLNEHGIGILNTALRVDYDEAEGRKIQKGARPSKDGARIRHALTMKTIEDAVKSVTDYQGGVKGHTIIVSNDTIYTVELTSKHKPVVTKHKAGTFLVRTNHGEKYTDAGYTPEKYPEDYESSVERHDDAVEALRKVRRPEEVLQALRNQPHAPKSNLNMFRDTDKLFTSSQVLLNVTDLVLELDWMSTKVEKMHGVTDKLPKGYTPKITIDIQKLTDKDITHMKEQSRVTAGTLLSTLKDIQEARPNFAKVTLPKFISSLPHALQTAGQWSKTTGAQSTVFTSADDDALNVVRHLALRANLQARDGYDPHSSRRHQITITGFLKEDYKGGTTSNCAYEDWDELSEDAEYDGKKVTLNKPFRSNDGKHKFYVYVKNDKGNVIRLGFGDPNMEIKRDDPDRRAAFLSRHNCDDPGPKWKAKYWSCKWGWGKKELPA